MLKVGSPMVPTKGLSTLSRASDGGAGARPRRADADNTSPPDLLAHALIQFRGNWDIFICSKTDWAVPMGILTNPRHELFVQELAKGKSASEAYATAGY
jgi:hypothetical protein